MAAVVFTVAAVGCNDERPAVEPPRPQLLPVASNAWIVVSDSTPAVGDEVVISAYAASPEGGSIGSFTARFLYDSLQLQVVSSDSIGDQVLRAVNPIVGEQRIAGAAATGIPGGLLFRVRARVLDPRGVQRLGLLVDEMHSVTFAELTSRLEVRDTRAALLAGMKGVRVQPPTEPRQ